MKVAIVCDVLGEANNGTSLAAYNLISFLKEQGHEVKVICADKDKKGKEGFEVVPTKNLGPINLILKANNVSLAKGDKELVKRAIEGADVVHILMPFWLGIMAAKIAKSEGIPVTASFHAQAENVTAHIACMNSRLANHITYLCFYHLLYKRVDMIHYPTQFIRSLFERQVKADMPCKVISNGVNDVFYAPCERERVSDKFTIFCMGRFSKEKAQQTLIKAVGKSPFRDDVKILFAGCGPKEKKLKRLAKRRKVDADFKFYSRKELPKALHSADLYVHTALVEIEAISCLEAIVSGLVPVICDSKRSATKNFALDEHCLFHAGSYKDLREKIFYFYKNPENIQKYREKYTNFKDQYRQEDCMKKMEEMLEDVAAK